MIVLYPVFSALPQEIIYRAFFFQKYSKFLKNDNLIVISSALLFSYLHIIFHNPVAVIFTLIGGFFFAKTYSETKSLFSTSFEHALYGNYIFTLGLGRYFYEGL
jgi:membrane protease YdiL (CAAX protease family)